MSLTQELRSMSLERQDKIMIGASVISGITFGAIYSINSTVVVAGATAVPGAISTTSVLTSSGTVVFSVVKASIGMKVLNFIVIGGATFLVTYYILSKARELAQKHL